MSTRNVDTLNVAPLKIKTSELVWETLREVILDIDAYAFQITSLRATFDVKKESEGTGYIRFVNVDATPPVNLGQRSFTENVWTRKKKELDVSLLPPNGEITIELQMKTDDVNEAKAKSVSIGVS